MTRPNRLSSESSPYLKQHAHNPVDWYPWGKLAFEKAKRESKPIFLSIGYSACHWCHVMERESFESVDIANFLNENFVSIKVDREERPDIDHLYMQAVQLLTSRGGWPLTVFLTPDLKPFYGGTYFPPEERYGMPSFKKVLTGILNFWTQKREEVNQSATQLTKAILELGDITSGADKASFPLPRWTEHAVHAIENIFDPHYGGFGQAPKFFHTGELKIALRDFYWNKNKKSLEVAHLSLEKIALGGIYDHLGGGVHRYSTDAEWHVPHFEKMLYDNALLSETWIEAFSVTHNPLFSRAAQETLDFCIRDLRHEKGGFFSTLDADTEGEEGKFYVWSYSEIQEILGEDLFKNFCQVFGITEQGNWEPGKNILHQQGTLEELAHTLSLDAESLFNDLQLAKRKLLQKRSQRAAPHRDEKILTSWNGMLLHSLCLAFQHFRNDGYLERAKELYKFVFESLLESETPTEIKLYRTQNKINGFLDDYAFFLNGVLSLYESTLQIEYLEKAQKIWTSIFNLFYEAGSQEFFFTQKDQSHLVVRPKEYTDGATPSATGMAITAGLRLSKITQDLNLRNCLTACLEKFHSKVADYPLGFSQMVLANDYLNPQAPEIHLIQGSQQEEFEEIRAFVHQSFLPGKTIKKEEKPISGKNGFFLCRNQTCKPEVNSLEEIEKILSEYDQN